MSGLIEWWVEMLCCRAVSSTCCLQHPSAPLILTYQAWGQLPTRLINNMRAQAGRSEVHSVGLRSSLLRAANNNLAVRLFPGHNCSIYISAGLCYMYYTFMMAIE